MVRKGGKIARLGVSPDHLIEELPFKFNVHHEIAIFGSCANPNVSRKIISLINKGSNVAAEFIPATTRPAS
jgi:threonine dehydrogenase-like Zn-dependent dehydrogenase